MTDDYIPTSEKLLVITYTPTMVSSIKHSFKSMSGVQRHLLRNVLGILMNAKIKPASVYQREKKVGRQKQAAVELAFIDDEDDRDLRRMIVEIRHINDVSSRDKGFTPFLYKVEDMGGLEDLVQEGETKLTNFLPKIG